MIFADILFWFLMVAGAYLALNAYWLAAVALFRPAVERARLTYATRPVAATLTGLLALIPVALVFVVPLLGWFAVFPLTLASGLGALFLPPRALAIPNHAPVPRLGKPPLQMDS